MATGGNEINNPDDTSRGIGELWATVEQYGEQMNTIQETLHNLTISLNADRDPTVNRNLAEGFARGWPIDDLFDRHVRRPICEEHHLR